VNEWALSLEKFSLNEGKGPREVISTTEKVGRGGFVVPPGENEQGYKKIKRSRSIQKKRCPDLGNSVVTPIAENQRKCHQDRDWGTRKREFGRRERKDRNH